MGKKTEIALAAICEALQEHSAEMARHDDRLDNLEKIVQSQAHDIARLEANMQHMRNRSIKSAIDRGVPTKVVAEAYGLSSGRITQIAPRKRPPVC